MESHTWLWRWKKKTWSCILVHISWPDRHVYFYRWLHADLFPEPNTPVRRVGMQGNMQKPLQHSGRQKRGEWQAETLRGWQKQKWNVFKVSLTRDFSLQVLFLNRFFPGPLSVNSNPTVSQRNKKKIPVSKFFHLSPGSLTPVINLYFRNGPYRNRETDSWKTPEVENLVSDSL